MGSTHLLLSSSAPLSHCWYRQPMKTHNRCISKASETSARKADNACWLEDYNNPQREREREREREQGRLKHAVTLFFSLVRLQSTLWLSTAATYSLGGTVWYYTNICGRWWWHQQQAASWLQCPPCWYTPGDFLLSPTSLEPPSTPGEQCWA